MKELWAPWRKHYMLAKKSKACIFCESGKSVSGKKKYILKKSSYSFCILNNYPYNNGHVMVAPRRHVKSLDRLNKNELFDLFNLVNLMKKRIDKLLKPHGYNIGLNLGSVAGAGFPGHVHIHIVPRWKGDTNFMPVVSDTKVISYSLEEMYRLLKE